MANIKTGNKKDKYRDEASISTLIEYITDPAKTPSGYIGGVGVDPNDICGSMLAVKERFGKPGGVQLQQHIITFSDGELRDPADASAIAGQMARVLGRRYQTVYAVHETAHPHIHFVCNSVSYVDGLKYTGTKREYNEIRTKFKRILKNYGINHLNYVSNT